MAFATDNRHIGIGFLAVVSTEAVSFYRNEVGQEASNACPLPRTPIPAAEKGMDGRILEFPVVLGFLTPQNGHSG
jgi:hypothetical protein